MKSLILLLALLWLLPSCTKSSAITAQYSQICEPDIKEDVIIIYSAAWCGPCKHYKKAYSKLKFNHRVIDVDNYGDFKCRNQTGSIPTTLLFKNGKFVRGFTGADVDELKKMIEEMQ